MSGLERCYASWSAKKETDAEAGDNGNSNHKSIWRGNNRRIMKNSFKCLHLDVQARFISTECFKSEVSNCPMCYAAGMVLHSCGWIPTKHGTEKSCIRCCCKHGPPRNRSIKCKTDANFSLSLIVLVLISFLIFSLYVLIYQATQLSDPCQRLLNMLLQLQI